MNTPYMLYDLSTLGLVSVSGPDACQLLQGQVTCNLHKITDTQNSLAALCNPQGRVISLFYLFLFKETYYLLMPRNMVDLSLRALKKYAIFYRVELKDASTAFTIRGYASATLPTYSTTKAYALIHLPQDHRRCLLVGDDTTHELLAPSAHLVDAAAWNALNIKQGIPTIYPQTSGKCLAHDLHLHQLQAIDFDKGCYTGQEIIARMHYRGKLKNHLYQAHLNSHTAPLPGSDIYNQAQQCCGILIDACRSGEKDYDALLITDATNATHNTLGLTPDTLFTIKAGL